MPNRSTTLISFLAVLATPVWALAAEDPSGENPTSTPAGAEVASSDTGSDDGPDAAKAIVRGFFFETGVGGGYAILDQKAVDPTNPFVKGREKLGPGSTIRFAAGIDITDSIGLSMGGGVAMITGQRNNTVRDLSVLHVDLTARVGIPLTDRLFLRLQPGGMLVWQSNAVDPTEVGPGVVVHTGLEYFVHVRHFSVGLDLSVYAPLSKFRMFASLAPTLKYTF